jgi:ribosomal protein S18 acetylase RimI-like enzyme
MAGEQIVAAWHVERREHEHFLTFVEIAPAYQNRRIGTWIVEGFVELAFHASADATLRVLKSNPRAKKLYERLGFVVEGESTTHHVMRRCVRQRSL